MPASRYKHIRPRFNQARAVPSSCESWINHRRADVDGDAGGGRAGGDLPENVTEERLHRGRLLDLAMERHKMMLERDYSKNQFIDHQMRKSKTLNKLLDHFDIEQYRNKSTSVVEKLRQKSVHAKLMILATKKLGLSIEETSKFSEEELRLRLGIPKMVVEEEEEEEEENVKSSLPLRPVTTRTEQQQHLQYLQYEPARPNSSANLLARRQTSGALRFPAAGAATHRPSSRRQFGSNVAAAAAAPSAGSLRPRTASARRRVQNDPRCTDLIKVLTPRYKVSIKTSVDHIIQSNPSLSQQPIGRGSSSGEAAEQLRQAPKSRSEALAMLDRINSLQFLQLPPVAEF